MKTYVVGPSTGYSRFIENLELVDKIEDAQVVLFTGGEDINPALYNCKRHESTYFNESRDEREVEAFKKVNPETQLCVGVCRGLMKIKLTLNRVNSSGKLRCQPAAKFGQKCP